MTTANGPERRHELGADGGFGAPSVRIAAALTWSGCRPDMGRVRRAHSLGTSAWVQRAEFSADIILTVSDQPSDLNATSENGLFTAGKLGPPRIWRPESALTKAAADQPGVIPASDLSTSELADA